MKIPILTGIIKRRMLINFRVDAAVMQKSLPAPFRPKLHKGYAIAGICLIRLEHIRPAGLPAFLGFSSENAAHRIAVEWDDPSGEQKEGVFIPRRDTASRLNHLTGGRIFSGEHHLAKFHVVDDGTNVDFTMESCDKAVSVRVRGFDSALGWTESQVVRDSVAAIIFLVQHPDSDSLPKIIGMARQPSSISGPSSLRSFSVFVFGSRPTHAVTRGTGGLLQPFAWRRSCRS